VISKHVISKYFKRLGLELEQVPELVLGLVQLLVQERVQLLELGLVKQLETELGLVLVQLLEL